MLNFTKGKAIANIYKVDGTNEEIVTKIKIEQSFKSDYQTHTSNKDKNLIIENNVFNLPDGYKMRLAPDHDKDQNTRIVIIAPSGAGKTTTIKNYIIDYRKKYPNKDVFLLSRHDADPSIDEAKPIRIKISEAEIIDAIKHKEPLITNKSLANSFIIFDDIFTAESKILTDYYFALASDLYQNARKLNIDLAFIMHNTDYGRTRYLMSESSHFIFYLRSGSSAMYQRLLQQYLGYKDKKVLKKLFDLPTRYVIFSNIAPLYIMTENQIIIPRHLDED